jgi:L-methionine (R)-S-oxide reductase
MFEIETRPATTDKVTLYAALAGDLRALLDHEHDLIANAANMASLIYHTLPDLNWAGFYFLKAGARHANESSAAAGRAGTAAPGHADDSTPAGNAGPAGTEGELVLGPFQGKPACVRIAMGKGVCGTAAQRRTSVVVPDVDAFPGHIACDSASRAELVVPVIHESRLLGVLDLDSPTPGRFDDLDREGCETLVRIFTDALAPAVAR